MEDDLYERHEKDPVWNSFDPLCNNIIGNEVDELGLILCGIPTVLGLIIAIVGLFNKSDD